METGIFDDNNIVVESGLEEDAQVLTTWTSELKEGTKVTLDTGAGEAAAEETAESQSQAQ